MRLVSLLDVSLIRCGGEAGSYAEARDGLLELLPDGALSDRGQVLNLLAARDHLSSTIVAPGVAFPHVRSSLLDDFYVVVGLFPGGAMVRQGSEPVRFVALFLIPTGADELYLRCLGAMARFCKTDGALERAAACTTGAEFIELMDETGIMVKKVATAADIMRVDPPRLRPESTIAEAADLMVAERTTFLPVVAADGSVRGIVTACCMLRTGIPEYLLEMDSVGFLSDSEPFSQRMKAAEGTAVSFCMEEEPVLVEVDTPLVVVARELVRRRLPGVPVVEEGRLVGVITAFDFVAKVIRA